MAFSIGLLIYAVVQFVAFLFVLVATPIDMFRVRSGNPILPNRCYTLWGLKLNCSDTNHRLTADFLWEACPTRRNRFRVAQAFALISIFVYAAAFVLGAIVLFCCRWLRWVCLTLNTVGAVTVCIVWASMVVTYTREEGTGCIALRINQMYGAGFVLLVVAWLLDILNLPVLLFLGQVSDPGVSTNATDNKSQESEEEIKEKETQD